MQCNCELDPDEQTNVQQCMITHCNQMATRWAKIKPCIAQVLTDLANTLLIVNVAYRNVFPPFPSHKLETKLRQVARQFEMNMNKWIDHALKKRTRSVITPSRLTTQARQQYEEESDFFAQCFVTMNAYIHQCVRMCIQIQSDTMRTVDLLHDIGLCMMIRFALIVLKRKHQWNNESGNFPIFRYKATVICNAFHVELDGRHPKKLSIVQWIQNRRAIARSDRKRAIGARKFCGYLRDYLQCVYHDMYYAVARRMALNISNIIEFEDQHITVCDLMTHSSVHVERKRNEILRYFEATPSESHSERAQGTDVEEKAEEQGLFPDGLAPEMSPFPMNDQLMSPPFIHDYNPPSTPRMHDINHNVCNAQISELQAQVQTLQQDKKALEAQVQKMQQRLNEYAYRERIHSLRSDANGNHYYDHNPRHNHTPQ